MTTSLLVVPFTLSAVFCALTAVLAWRRRVNTPAARALAVAMTGIALWSATGVFSHLPVDLVLQRVTGMISFVGVYLTVTGLWCASRAVTDRHWRLRRPVALRLAITSGLLLGAVITNPWHYLFFSSVTASATGTELHVQAGPIFWIHLAYSYLLMGWSVQRLATAWRHARSVFRHQLSHLLLASCIPVLGNVAVLAGTHGERAVDYTPLFLALTGLIDARAIFRHSLLRLVPVARAQVVDGIEDAVIVIDPDGQVIDVNPAALTLLRRSTDLPNEVIGLPALQVLPPPLSRLLHGEAVRERAELGTGVHVDARVSALHDARGRAVGQVVVLRDISELMQQREVAQRANQRLSEQLAITQALQQRLAEEAVRDSLTGLHNRRYLMQVLEQALTHARRSGEQLSIVLIDVDHFKAVNDTYGHHGGDTVLQTVAAQLQQACRAEDTLARYGGEEFILLLPATSHTDALHRAEQLRRHCAQTLIAVPTLLTGPPSPVPSAPIGGPHPRRLDVSVSVTFSAGVATSPEHGIDADRLIAIADQALYAAKAAGRNQVIAAR